MTTQARHAITSPSGRLRAEFAPDAAMVCCSLRAGERELLAQRHGLEAYAQRGATMGIPLLYPWANRLATFSYEAAGRRVQLSPDSPLLPRDPAGLPIHGVLPGMLRFDLTGSPAPSSIAATLHWEDPDLLELFPFPHRLDYRATLEEAGLTITLTVHAGRDGPVPVSFGFHPYLALPPGARADAEVELPVHERLVLDERMIPTGEREHFAPGRRPLGGRDWDDAFAGPQPPATATVIAGADRTELDFLAGFSCSQLYAPRDSDFVCIEPMTAPTDALGGGTAPEIEPGASFAASFRIAPALSARSPAGPRS